MTHRLVSWRPLIVGLVGVLTAMAAACGTAGSGGSASPTVTAALSASPTGSSSATPAESSSATPAESSSATPAATQAELVAVAQRYISPNGVPCDINAPAGAQHYAHCPFTAALQARYVAFSPNGQFTAPNAMAGGYEFLCHCQSYFPIVSYQATPTPGGGSVTMTTQVVAGSSYSFTVTMVDSGDALLIGDIKITDGPCNDVELTACTD